MNHHFTPPTNGQHPDDGTALGVTVVNGHGAVDSGEGERTHSRVMQARLWSHTLIIKGNLDQHSAPELEDELECLRQEGVSALTLDLRDVDAVDPSAAQVVAFQSALYTARGQRFAIRVESPVIRRALAEAGWTDRMTPKPAVITARRISSLSLQRATPDLSTTMIRDLDLV